MGRCYGVVENMIQNMLPQGPVLIVKSFSNVDLVIAGGCAGSNDFFLADKPFGSALCPEPTLVTHIGALRCVFVKPSGESLIRGRK